jgi:S1-C subfamily serine protease
LDEEAWGVETETAKKGLRIIGVKEQKPFMRSGVQKGDEILAVNGSTPENAEELRQILVRASIIGPTAFLSISRSGKVYILAVEIPETTP